jgi:hypothetical protein
LLLADIVEADHGHAKKEKSSRPLLSHLKQQGKAYSLPFGLRMILSENPLHTPHQVRGMLFRIMH